MHELLRFGMHLTHNTTRYIGPTSRMTCRTYSTQVVQSSSVRENILHEFSVLRYSYYGSGTVHTFAPVRMSSRCQNTGVLAFPHSGRNDRHQRVDRDSCFALPFLQTVAVTMLLQFGEDPENIPSSQSHENTYQLPGCTMFGSVRLSGSSSAICKTLPSGSHDLYRLKSLL